MTGAQEVWSLKRRPARLLIHAHTCALSRWIVNVLLRVERIQGNDSNLLPGSNTWLSANMLFVPSKMSLLLHKSFFFSSSKCPSLFQLIFVLLLARTLPSPLLLDPESRRSVAPLYLRLAESVEEPKAGFLLKWAGEGLRCSHLQTVSPSIWNVLTLTCSMHPWWTCRHGTSPQPASEISRSGRVHWTLNRPVFTTAHLLLSGWFWSQGWQFPRGKHKLQVVMSMRGQRGHTTLLHEGRNPKGNPKLRTCKSPLLCRI